jgi:HlyD family secretion protein
MTSDIVIQTNKKDNIVRIPKNAVENIDGTDTIQVVNRGKIENRKITVGLEGNDYFEVLSGLSEGNEIITGKK